MAVDVKAALLSYRQEPSLTNGDRAHIDRWLAVAKAPVWQKIVADIETTGKLPRIVGGTFGFVIARTLRIRKFAETAEYESAAIKKRKQLESEQRTQELLDFASDIESVVARIRNRRFFEFPPSPSGESKSQLEARRSLEWLDNRSQQLRKRASPQDFFFVDKTQIVVSRQSGGRGKRIRSRELGVFMKSMVNFMYEWVRKPRYEFVANLTNVAFIDADVGAEEVRQSCKRRRTGTLGG